MWPLRTRRGGTLSSLSHHLTQSYTCYHVDITPVYSVVCHKKYNTISSFCQTTMLFRSPQEPPRSFAFCKCVFCFSYVFYASWSLPDIYVVCVVYVINTSWYIRFMCCICHEHFLTHTFCVLTHTFYVLYISWTLLDTYVLCVVYVMNTSRHIRFVSCMCHEHFRHIRFVCFLRHEHFPIHTFYVPPFFVCLFIQLWKSVTKNLITSFVFPKLPETGLNSHTCNENLHVQFCVFDYV